MLGWLPHEVVHAVRNAPSLLAQSADCLWGKVEALGAALGLEAAQVRTEKGLAVDGQCWRALAPCGS